MGTLSLAFHDCILTAFGSAGAVAGVVWSVALTPDDCYAVTGSEDFTARVWDMRTGACAREMAGHRGWIMEVVVTPDGTRVLTASHDGTARCVLVCPPPPPTKDDW